VSLCRAASNKPISETRPLILGHRGASAVAPENTLAAFARAFDDGADGIELDVRLSRDGVPVVIHDATLQRTGLVEGDVEQLTAAQLAKIDVGSWFNRAYPARARGEYAEQRLPRLSQVLERCRPRPGVIYIELKSQRGTATDNLVRSVAEAITEFEFQRRTVVVSFDYDAIATTKALAATIRTGALFAPAHPSRSAWRREKILRAAGDCGADEILLHRALVRRNLVEQARDRNFPVVVWTVDDSKWIERAQTLGVHALITNDPAKMLAVA
jgi:glycerophosphoryl diester phosphodiesterase